MTLIVLTVSSFIAAWARYVARTQRRAEVSMLADAIAVMFLALAIGAGIQFTFKG